MPKKLNIAVQQMLRPHPLRLILAGAMASLTALAPTQVYAIADNHVFISYHGAPTYQYTIKYFGAKGILLRKESGLKTGKKASFSFAPPIQKVQISVGGAWNDVRHDWSFVAYHRDHCYLVQANGRVYYTGDETTGCTNK